MSMAGQLDETRHKGFQMESVDRELECQPFNGAGNS